ncbi:MAG: hypothetical protein HXS48_00970 [Theionarchaea archaeon]|nr:hypothetical protein [Theionarchaea archaeon]
MQKKVVTFSLQEYKPQGIIKTPWNETIKWTAEDEKLFREFKYDGRKKLTPIMKKHLIPKSLKYFILHKKVLTQLLKSIEYPICE